MDSNAAPPDPHSAMESNATPAGPGNGPLSAKPDVLHTVGEAVGNLFPGYFALVMATGIVSIACWLTGFTSIARVLLAINIVAFVVLWILTIVRVVRYRGRFTADVTDHRRGPGFFTIVAATCVLGTQLLVVMDSEGAAWWLWTAGAVFWVLVTYTFFTAVTVHEEKPTLDVGINGAWLLAIVATQALSVLSTMLGGRGEHQQALFFVALCLTLAGCLLYVVIITLIVYRFSFFRLTMAALTPPYWINMGAVAITTLAFALLVLNAHHSTLLTELLPFLKGCMLTFWAAATWWIPLLVILGAWRHIIRHFPLEYDPQYWGMVFPLGMYTVCTWRMAEALQLPVLFAIPRVFIYIDLAAWLAAFVGLLIRLTSLLRPAAESA